METDKKYCDIEDSCRLVAELTEKYNALINENQKIQQNEEWLQGEMQKDNEYLMKLEEANILFEEDIETLKRQVEKLKDLTDEIREMAEKYYCMHPEECVMNQPDWVGEVQGCNPDDTHDISSCPFKVASFIRNKIKEV